MPCNPSIGGPAKGHVVREIDALGGEMGRNTDRTFIQIRMLNTSKGPAVQALRAQCDKKLYQLAMKTALETTPNLDLKQGAAAQLLLEPLAGRRGSRGGGHARPQRRRRRGGAAQPAPPPAGDRASSPPPGAPTAPRSVVLTTGTFLRGRIIMGEVTASAGPGGRGAVDRPGREPGRAAASRCCGSRPARRRALTPAPSTGAWSSTSSAAPRRWPSATRRWSRCCARRCPPTPTRQPTAWRPQMPCYLVHTTAATHDVIRANLHRAPMFNGSIEGVGPRYCPSIEDKIVRFAHKESHQLFLEPEGWETHEVYVQGANTSLPEDVQWADAAHHPGPARRRDHAHRLRGRVRRRAHHRDHRRDGVEARGRASSWPGRSTARRATRRPPGRASWPGINAALAAGRADQATGTTRSKRSTPAPAPLRRLAGGRADGRHHARHRARRWTRAGCWCCRAACPTSA